jgi:hypothetical protein
MFKPDKIIFLGLFLFGGGAILVEEIPAREGIQVERSQGDFYRNQEQGYRLWLPPELQVNFEKKNDPEWAAQNRMPFDYVNFRPKKPAGNEQGFFELGVGVHWNRDKLSAREFADIKDEGVRQTVRQYVTVRSGEVSVAGIKGVRDDFALEKEFGWLSYSRVIIPYQDKFFVFLGTLGRNKPVSEYERIFQEIIDKFQLEK